MMRRNKYGVTGEVTLMSLVKEEKHRADFRQLMEDTVDVPTAMRYRGTVTRLEKLWPGCTEDPCEFAIYAKENHQWKKGEEGLAASTLKGYKSACIHVAWVEGRPWNQHLSSAVDRILEGLENNEEARKRRGQLSRAQLEACEKYAAEQWKKTGEEQWRDAAEGMRVVWGCTTRPRDIGAIRRRHYVLPWETRGSADQPPTRIDVPAEGDEDGELLPTLWVRRKALRNKRQKEGEDEPHVPLCEKAWWILQSRYNKATGEDDLLFPHFDTKVCSEIVKAVADIHSWDPNVVWDGAHTARHGHARSMIDKSLRSHMKYGGWTEPKSMEHYAFSSRGGRPNPPAQSPSGGPGRASAGKKKPARTSRK